MRLNAKQIVHYTGGRFLVEPIDGAELFSGITWDSRDVEPGDLYVALPGERVDGHAFVEDALRAGARGALVTMAPSASACLYASELGAAIIEVPDTQHAITDLACAWRGHLKGRVIALTGSVGKTTTKNLLRDVASTTFSCVATLANQNNELGVPKTLLEANPETEVVIVEMGMRGLGQIKELCQIARPEWGIITNIGDCHIELLGSRDNVAAAKAELFEALPAGSGRAFVNASDAYAAYLIERADVAHANAQISLFGAPFVEGLDEEVDGRIVQAVFAQDIALDGEGRPQFTLCFEERHVEAAAPTLFDMDPDRVCVPCHLSLRGIHNVTNACAAAAVCAALGISPERIARALSASVPEAGRLQTLRAHDGFLILTDAYNANPDSMRAALTMFSSMDVRGRRYAVLGDMGELGAVAQACHEGIGDLIATLDIDMLICVGELSRSIARRAIEGGMDAQAVLCASSIGEVLEALEGRLDAQDAVLVKASHAMELNRVVDGLVN